MLTTRPPAAPPPPTGDFESFRRRAYAIAGVDLASYKVPQMQRRLGVLLGRARAGSFAEYARILERDADRRREFRDFVTINVTEFFRDAERYAELESALLPALLAGGRALRVWSAGCSNGAEVYSLAMLLKERAPGRPHVVLGTDIDDGSLARARAGGPYTRADVRGVAAPRLARWFAAAAPGQYALAPALRDLVTWQRQDLVRDPPPAGAFDLVLCRNVVIYFTDQAKDRVFETLVGTLRPGGLLFVGATEVLMHAGSIGLDVVGPGFYRRRGG